MDDQFMLGGLRRPRAEFARRLSERLDELDIEQPATPRYTRPAARVTAWAAAILLAVGAFAIPQVRAGAQAFLDLFRVVNFASVAVEPARIQEVLSKQDGAELPRLLGEQFQILKQPGPLQPVATLDAASAAAGIRVRTPAWLPVGIEQQNIAVIGESAARVTASTEKLKRVMDAFGIDDITVPDVDGQIITMHTSPIVTISYGNARRHVALMQARQPEVSFPAGTDLSLLAEVALRVMGIQRTEAHRFAQSVDWRTTLLVPVPADVARFRQVDVQGRPGLLIERTRQRPDQNDEDGEGSRPEAQIMWSSGDSVFVLTGNVGSMELLEVAHSVQ